MKKEHGFTLIELMIAMTILAFISLALYQNTSQSFALREKIEQEGDFYNSVRVALDIIGRDVSHLYSPHTGALPGKLGKPASEEERANPGSGAAQQLSAPASDFWSEPINANGVRLSRLQGDSSKLSFVINSHMRLFRDSAESDFAKIVYSLEDDPNAPKGSRGRALIKKEDPNSFEDEGRKSETEVSYTLLSNVKSIEFKFLHGEKDSWDTRWDTAGIDHKNVFPSVIQVNIEVFLPNSELTLKVSQWFRTELQI